MCKIAFRKDIVFYTSEFSALLLLRLFDKITPLSLSVILNESRE